MTMRLMLCLLCLSGCAAPNIRCDSHLQPINVAGASVTFSADHPAQKVP